MKLSNLYTLSFVFTLTIVSVSISSTICYEMCPKSTVLDYSGCHFITLLEKCDIVCDSLNKPDLTLGQIFHNLSVALKEEEKQFNDLHIMDDDMVELNANVFADIQFHSILIECESLTRVHRLAFNGTHRLLVELTVKAPFTDAKPDAEYNVFAAISAIRSLQTLKMSATHLSAITDGALHSLHFLNDIDIIDSRIVRIEANAFRDLPVLKNLNLKSNHIRDIDVNAFPVIDVPFNKYLEIHLENDQLTSGSLKAGVFAAIKRPVKLYISDNDFEYLNETIFGPFIRQNPLNVINSKTNCMDSNNDWLRNKYPKQWVDENC